MRFKWQTIGDVVFASACVVMFALGGLQIQDVLVRRSQTAVPLGTAAAPESVDGLTINTSNAIVKGRGAAGIALVEFSDFQCPYCGQFARDTYSQIQMDFVNTGRLEYVYFNLPLEGAHPAALHASEAAECAGQQHRFWEMHDVLFKNQNALAEQDLLRHGRTLGLQLPQFQECLAGTTVQKIRDQIAVAQLAGVNSTPTFLIGQVESPSSIRVKYRVRGAASYERLARVLNDILKVTKAAD